MNKNVSLGIISILIIVFGFFTLAKTHQSPQKQTQNNPQVLANQTQSIGTRTKAENCVAHDGLEDKACTPGQIIPDATHDQICQPGYSKQVRNVPQSEKNDVYAQYNIYTRKPGEYEVDHLISLELGGSNDISNLWPEAAEPRPGFHEKDTVENYLHTKVCSGEISLTDAQIKIANNWLDIYNNIPK